MLYERKSSSEVVYTSTIENKFPNYHYSESEQLQVKLLSDIKGTTSISISQATIVPDTVTLLKNSIRVDLLQPSVANGNNVQVKVPVALTSSDNSLLGSVGQIATVTPTSGGSGSCTNSDRLNMCTLQLPRNSWSTTGDRIVDFTIVKGGSKTVSLTLPRIPEWAHHAYVEGNLETEFDTLDTFLPELSFNNSFTSLNKNTMFVVGPPSVAYAGEIVEVHVYLKLVGGTFGTEVFDTQHRLFQVSASITYDESKVSYMGSNGNTNNLVCKGQTNVDACNLPNPSGAGGYEIAEQTLDGVIPDKTGLGDNEVAQNFLIRPNSNYGQLGKEGIEQGVVRLMTLKFRVKDNAENGKFFSWFVNAISVDKDSNIQNGVSDPFPVFTEGCNSNEACGHSIVAFSDRREMNAYGTDLSVQSITDTSFHAFPKSTVPNLLGASDSSSINIGSNFIKTAVVTDYIGTDVSKLLKTAAVTFSGTECDDGFTCGTDSLQLNGNTVSGLKDFDVSSGGLPGTLSLTIVKPEYTIEANSAYGKFANCSNTYEHIKVKAIASISGTSMDVTNLGGLTVTGGPGTITDGILSPTEESPPITITLGDVEKQISFDSSKNPTPILVSRIVTTSSASLTSSSSALTLKHVFTGVETGTMYSSVSTDGGLTFIPTNNYGILNLNGTENLFDVSGNQAGDFQLKVLESAEFTCETDRIVAQWKACEDKSFENFNVPVFLNMPSLSGAEFDPKSVGTRFPTDDPAVVLGSSSNTFTVQFKEIVTSRDGINTSRNKEPSSIVHDPCLTRSGDGNGRFTFTVGNSCSAEDITITGSIASFSASVTVSVDRTSSLELEGRLHPSSNSFATNVTVQPFPCDIDKNHRVKIQAKGSRVRSITGSSEVYTNFKGKITVSNPGLINIDQTVLEFDPSNFGVIGLDCTYTPDYDIDTITNKLNVEFSSVPSNISSLTYVSLGSLFKAKQNVIQTKNYEIRFDNGVVSTIGNNNMLLADLLPNVPESSVPTSIAVGHSGNQIQLQLLDNHNSQVTVSTQSCDGIISATQNLKPNLEPSFVGDLDLAVGSDSNLGPSGETEAIMPFGIDIDVYADVTGLNTLQWNLLFFDGSNNPINHVQSATSNVVRSVSADNGFTFSVVPEGTESVVSNKFIITATNDGVRSGKVKMGSFQILSMDSPDDKLTVTGVLTETLDIDAERDTSPRDVIASKFTNLTFTSIGRRRLSIQEERDIYQKSVTRAIHSRKLNLRTNVLANKFGADTGNCNDFVFGDLDGDGVLSSVDNAMASVFINQRGTFGADIVDDLTAANCLVRLAYLNPNFDNNIDVRDSAFYLNAFAQQRSLVDGWTYSCNSGVNTINFNMSTAVNDATVHLGSKVFFEITGGASLASDDGTSGTLVSDSGTSGDNTYIQGFTSDSVMHSISFTHLTSFSVAIRVEYDSGQVLEVGTTTKDGSTFVSRYDAASLSTNFPLDGVDGYPFGYPLLSTSLTSVPVCVSSVSPSPPSAPFVIQSVNFTAGRRTSFGLTVDPEEDSVSTLLPVGSIVQKDSSIVRVNSSGVESVTGNLFDKFEKHKGYFVITPTDHSTIFFGPPVDPLRSFTLSASTQTTISFGSLPDSLTIKEKVGTINGLLIERDDTYLHIFDNELSNVEFSSFEAGKGYLFNSPTDVDVTV